MKEFKEDQEPADAKVPERAVSAITNTADMEDYRVVSSGYWVWVEYNRPSRAAQSLKGVDGGA